VWVVNYVQHLNAELGKIGGKMLVVNPTKKICYPDGSLDAKIVLVGEAPGVEEEKHGRGFVGSSGQLLFRLAMSAGITRNECYVTNVVKERPKGNDISQFITFRGSNVNRTPEYNKYEADLHEELLKTKANVYVAIGSVALYALTRMVAISKRRGSILEGTLSANGVVRKIKVIPIIHPAVALRQYTLMRTIGLDLKRIEEESKFPELRLPIRNIIIRPSFYDALQFLSTCKESKLVAFDIEVMREEVSCISFAYSPAHIISIPFQASGTDYFTPEQECEIWKHITSIIEDPDIIKVGQNIVFDTTFLFRKYGISPKGILEDTMIGQAIMYPDYPKGLDFITSVHTKEPYYKDEGKKHFKIGGPEEDFWIYNAKDSAVCIEALQRIKADLESINNLDAYEVQCKLVKPLIYMQERGIKTNRDGLIEEAIRVGARIEELKIKLNELTGYDINPGSSAQVQHYFYKIKGEKPYINRSTGRPTADKNAIKRLSRKGYEEAKVLQEISTLSYLKSHYLDVTLDTDSRLRCSFNPVGTQSGRLSSSETIFGTGTNMQNLPMEFRKYLIADDDTMMYNIDLSQAENRVVAYISPEPNMIGAFEKHIDLHRQTAGLIFSKSWEDVSDEQGSSSIGGGNFSERFWGKKANHGLNYDLGYKAFAFLYEIPEADAKFIVERYHKAYPGVRQYHAWVRHQLSKNRTLENLFGRKRLFLDRWGDELFKSAYSFIPQSTVAEIINRRGVIYIYYNQETFAPVDLLLQVHDNIIFQMNYKKYSWERQAECLLLIKQSLETPLTWRGNDFNIPVNIEVGMTLNKDNMAKVDHATGSVAELAKCLSETQEKLKASLAV
jgi:uracil-DNA glycosylase family 4